MEGPNPRPRSGFQERSYAWAEAKSLEFVSPAGPGRLMKHFYRGPIWLYRLGLGFAIGKSTMLLWTQGRKTGKWRPTPLGYSFDEVAGTYYVVSGWAERSQWYRNLDANPHVRIEAGRRKLRAVAELADPELAFRIHRDYLARNPRAASFWPKVTGLPFDGSDDAIRQISERCPVVALKPRAKIRVPRDLQRAD